jgi:uncharacterized protein YggE
VGRRRVTVTGSGTAATRPDALRLAIALEAGGATPAEALAACRVAQDAVLAVLAASVTVTWRLLAR